MPIESHLVAYKVGEPDRIRKNDALFSNEAVPFAEKNGFSSHHLFSDEEAVGKAGLDEDRLIEELKKQPNPEKSSNGDDAVLFIFHDDHLHKNGINAGDMRRVNGLAFIEKLKKNNIHIPTVFVTKKAWSPAVASSIDELRKEGFIHYHTSDPREGPYYKAITDNGSMRNAAHAAIDRFHRNMGEKTPEPTTQNSTVQGSIDSPHIG